MSSCNTVQKVRFQIRRGTDAYWNSQAATVPFDGEPCFNSERNQLKIGNGGNTWGTLPYINLQGPPGTYTNLVSSRNISVPVTLATGKNEFGIVGNTLSWEVGDRIQFSSEQCPPPLNRFVTYYALEAGDAGSDAIRVSETLGGPNVVLLASVVSKSGADITIDNNVEGEDAAFFTTGAVNPRQALFFTNIGDPELVDNNILSTEILYYLVNISTNGSFGVLNPSQAIIQVSSTFSGPAIN